jgi:hypothetical protein
MTVGTSLRSRSWRKETEPALVGTDRSLPCVAPIACNGISSGGLSPCLSPIAPTKIDTVSVISFSGVDITGTNGSGAIGAIGTGNSGRSAPTASLTPTRSGSWVVGVGNDYDNVIARTPGSGQRLVHQFLTPTGDTYWVQIQNNPTPTSGTSSCPMPGCWSQGWGRISATSPMK